MTNLAQDADASEITVQSRDMSSLLPSQRQQLVKHIAARWREVAGQMNVECTDITNNVPAGSNDATCADELVRQLHSGCVTFEALIIALNVCKLQKVVRDLEFLNIGMLLVALLHVYSHHAPQVY